MTDTMGQVDRFGQPVPAEPGYATFINHDGSQPQMRTRVHLDNTLLASDDPITDATMLVARGAVVPIQGLSLPDGNVEISILDGSEFTLWSATGNVVVKCSNLGSPISGESIIVNVRRSSASTVTFTNDVDASVFVVPASVKMTVSISFDGSHFGSAHAIRIE